uniref:Innexin n=1 Tax=Megaselia scalaris TaxID=36166 RepID=T1GB50_MEGSC
MAVLGLASVVSSFIKIRYLVDKAVIDNLVFRCHYRVTSAILFLCCVVVTANNLIGEPISCINDGSIPMHVINTFCWITYTYSIPGLLNKNVGTEVAAPGAGNDYGQEKRYHSYYQWVPFVLFLQGIMFYIPHWIWKNWENGKVRIVTEAKSSSIFVGSFKTHNGYSFGYFFCELLNFLNVILNMFMVDKFLGGTFLKYGTEVIKFSNMQQENRTDPMIEIFPRLTKCTFHKYGPGGSLQNHDTLCLLALNILNEKIYVFLWFWFYVLMGLSACTIIYSGIVIMLPTSREKIIKRRFRSDHNKMNIKELVRRLDIGDFLLVHLIGQNINVNSYSDIITDLCVGYLESPGETPSAPSTLEMQTIYPEVEKFGKEEGC